MYFYEYNLLWGPGVSINRIMRDQPHFESIARGFWKQVIITDSESMSSLAALSEIEWVENVRPYYKVYPAFCDMLSRVKLDLRVCQIPLCRWGAVCVRLPRIPMFVRGMLRLQTLLVTVVPEGGNCLGGFLITLQYYIEHRSAFMPGWLVYFGQDEITIEEKLSRFRMTEGDIELSLHPDDTKELELIATKLAVGVILLGNDPDFAEPEVLANHRQKYEESKNPKYIEKARKRGIRGWRLGERFESCPHYRRPHLGLRWTGKGRGVPRIVPIKGSIVHRKTMERVPTGYILPDGREIEPNE